MKSNNEPRVSIGMPVFNGEKYLKEAIDSILAQTYQCFELIISDNASTDRTQQICQSYAANDKRIRYYRNKTNIGASLNFNRVFELSSGEYFKWACHDDVLAPEFLSKCVKRLDQDPSTVICFSKTARINESGEITGSYKYNQVTSSKSNERFAQMICTHYHAWVLIFGLMRSSYLKKTRLLGSYISADRNLLAELSLLGPMREIPEYLFFRREHKDSYTNKGYDTYREKLDWWTKNGARTKLCFPYSRLLREYFNSVRRIPLKWSERMRCYTRIVKWLIEEGWLLMGLDIGMNLIGPSKFRSNLSLIAEWFLHRGGIS